MAGRNLVLFEEAIKSPETRKLYKMAVERFHNDTGIELQTTKLKGKQLQEKIIEYVIQMKKEGRSYSSANNIVSGLQKFCETFDIEVNWKKVRGYLPEQTSTHQDTPYTIEQLRKLVDISDYRLKAVILFMLSSGCRVGALPLLRIGDLKRTGEIYQVRVYANSPKDAYTTFCSVEATKAIDNMLEVRKRRGEIIKPDSPLFRADIDHEIKPASALVIRQRIHHLVVRAGIRVPGEDRKKRQGTMLTHSFRKIANTAFVRAGIKPVVVEMLMGHTTGLQANYLRLSEEELLQEYLKAQDLLMISQEKQLQKQVERLQVQSGDVSLIKAMLLKKDETVEELKDMLGGAMDTIEELKEEINKLKASKN